MHFLIKIFAGLSHLSDQLRGCPVWKCPGDVGGNVQGEMSLSYTRNFGSRTIRRRTIRRGQFVAGQFVEDNSSQDNSSQDNSSQDNSSQNMILLYASVAPWSKLSL